MLVLNRKCGEVIVIANDITVTVLGVQGGRVKLWAPRRQFLCPSAERNCPRKSLSARAMPLPRSKLRSLPDSTAEYS